MVLWTFWDDSNYDDPNWDNPSSQNPNTSNTIVGKMIGRQFSIGETVTDPLTITWKDAGYLIDGSRIGLRLTITKVHVNDFDYDIEQAFWNTTAGWDPVLYWQQPSYWTVNFCSLPATKKIDFTLEVVRNAGTDANPRYERVDVPVQWGYNDIDQTDYSGEYCSAYDGDVALTRAYSEGIRIYDGVTHTYISSDSLLNRDIINASGNTWFYGTQVTGWQAGPDNPENRAAVVMYSPHGYFKGAWTGAWCATGVAATVIGGTITELDDPVKSTPQDVVNEGSTVTFNVDQKLPCVPNEVSAHSITFTDTLSPSLEPVSLRVYKGSADVTSDWNVTCSSSSQTVTASAKNTGRSGAQGDHRFVVTAKVRSGLDYSKLARDDADSSYYKIPNKANVTLVPFANGSPISKNTNEVRVRVKAATIALSKSANVFEVKPNGMVDYTLTVRNTEPGSIARNIVVSDSSLPSSDFQVTKVDVPDAVPPARVLGNSVSVTIPSLAYNSTATIKVHAKALAASNGKFVPNEASATFGNPKPGAANPVKDTEGVWVNQPAISSSKSVDKAEAHAGDVLHYTVTVRNTAPAGTIARSVTVKDALPDTLALDPSSIKVSGIPATVSVPKDTDSSNAGSDSRGNTHVLDNANPQNGFTLLIPYLPASSTPVTVTYAATVKNEANGTFARNKLEVATPDDPDIPNKSVDVLVSDPALTITKSANSHEYSVGDEITYTVKVRQTEKGAVARNIEIDDPLPAGLEIVEGSMAVALPCEVGTKIPAKVISAPHVESDYTGNASYTYQPASAKAEGRRVHVTIPVLGDEGDAVITYKVRATAASQGKRLINTASITCSNLAPDDAPKYPVKASDDIWINGSKMKVSKTADAFEYEIGQTAHFTIGVRNDAKPGTIAKNVVIRDTQLPEDFKIDMSSIHVDGVPSPIAYPIDGAGTLREEQRENPVEVVPDANGAGFTVRFPYLPQGSDVKITYDASAVRAINGLDALNRVTVTADGDPGGESKTHVWTNTADLAIDKSVDKEEYLIGDVATYDISVRNTAVGTVAKDVYVADVALPSYMEVVAGSVQVEGVPEKVMYPVGAGEGNSQRIDEERGNSVQVLYEGEEGFDTAVAEASYSNCSYSYSPIKPVNADVEAEGDTPDAGAPSETTAGNGWIVKIGYLPYGDVVKIRFQAKVEDLANGRMIENFVSADCENSDKTLPEYSEEQVPDSTPGAGNAPADPDFGGDTEEPLWRGPVHARAEMYVNEPSLAVSKSADRHHARPGETVHYTINVTNPVRGTVADTVTIADAIEPVDPDVRLENVRVLAGDNLDELEELEGAVVIMDDAAQTITVETNASIIADGFYDKVLNRDEILQDGVANHEQVAQYKHIILSYDVPVTESMAAKTFRNIATAECGNGHGDRDDEDLAITSLKRGQQVTAYKSSNPPSGSVVAEGDEITYTITTKNTGSATAQYTVVRDYLPVGTEFISADQGGVFVAPAKPDAPDAGSDNKGEGDPGDVGNEPDIESDVTSDEGTTPNEEDENNAVSDSDGEKQPSLSFTADVSEDNGNGYVEWVLGSIAPGQEALVSYKVVVKAQSLQAAADETAKDESTVAPSGNENTDADDSENGDGDVAEAPDSDVWLPTYIRNIARYESFDEDPGVPGQIPGDLVPDKKTNEVIHSTNPDRPCPAVIDVEKTSEPVPGTTVHNSDRIRYSLIVRNNGGSDGENILVRDYIDGKLEVDTATISDAGAYDAALRRIDWIVASLAPGEQKMLSFEAAVANTQPTDIIPNQALFENAWDGGVAPDGTVREPANSTNVIEHVSDGDYMVASEEIAVTGIVSETGGDLVFLLAMAIILACAVGAGVAVMARSRFRA